MSVHKMLITWMSAAPPISHGVGPIGVHDTRCAGSCRPVDSRNRQNQTLGGIARARRMGTRPGRTHVAAKPGGMVRSRLRLMAMRGDPSCHGPPWPSAADSRWPCHPDLLLHAFALETRRRALPACARAQIMDRNHPGMPGLPGACGAGIGRSGEGMGPLAFIF